MSPQSLIQSFILKGLIGDNQERITVNVIGRGMALWTFLLNFY